MKHAIRRTLAALALLFITATPLAIAQPVDLPQPAPAAAVAPADPATTNSAGQPAVVQPADLPVAVTSPLTNGPGGPLPLTPVIALLGSGLVWLVTLVAKKISPDLDAAKVAPWIGTALGAALALVTYLTGIFPSATWMQTVYLVLTTISGGIGSGIGAGILDRRFIKPVLKGEPTVEAKVAAIETTPGIKKAPKV